MGVISSSGFAFGFILGVILFIVAMLLILAGFIFFETIILWVVSRLLNMRKKDLKTAAYAVLATYAVPIALGVIQMPIKFLVKNWVISLLVSVIFFVISFAISVYMVKRCYNEGWLKALAAYLILFVVTILLTIIVGIIIGVGAFALLGATLKSIGAGI